MIETDDFIIAHVPKCGGTVLSLYCAGNEIHRPHDGLWALTEDERSKKIYALTRGPKAWYQSMFQFFVQRKNPWLAEFGLDYVANLDNFKQFLYKATVAPPPKQHLKTPTMVSVPYDSFQMMREREYGFWSFWHEFLCSDDLANPAIANDVSFVPNGHPAFFPPGRLNVSKRLEIEWTPEMLEFIEVDSKIQDIVLHQQVDPDMEKLMKIRKWPLSKAFFRALHTRLTAN
ncbi:MAG: hypothetical protein ACJAVI_005039 [Candidatus Azotimanducaceae bacterium]|jgi:hypothetical protein